MRRQSVLQESMAEIELEKLKRTHIDLKEWNDQKEVELRGANKELEKYREQFLELKDELDKKDT